MFTGDTIFSGCQTWLMTSDVDQWLEALETIRSLDVEHILPGHGPVVTKTYLDTQRVQSPRLEVGGRGRRGQGLDPGGDHRPGELRRPLPGGHRSGIHDGPHPDAERSLPLRQDDRRCLDASLSAPTRRGGLTSWGRADHRRRRTTAACRRGCFGQHGGRADPDPHRGDHQGRDTAHTSGSRPDRRRWSGRSAPTWRFALRNPDLYVNGVQGQHGEQCRDTGRAGRRSDRRRGGRSRLLPRLLRLGQTVSGGGSATSRHPGRGCGTVATSACAQFIVQSGRPHRRLLSEPSWP